MTITLKTSDLAMRAGAIFSECMTYRYLLWREWDQSKPTMVFCMLNPSTASHEVLDPTVTRCLSRATAMGFGRLVVVNLFAMRSTDPRELAKVSDPIGPENDRHILVAARDAGLVVCGWGNDRAVGDRGSRTLALMRAAGVVPHALFLNRNGSPKHPLYVAAALNPVPMP